MTTLTNVNKPKILILDSNATPQDITANASAVGAPRVNPLRLSVASCERIGAYYEVAHTDTLNTAQKAFSWDLILAPCIDDAVNANYTDFETAIGTFTDTTIPVAIMQVVAPGLNATIQAVTGCGADIAATTTSCDTFNWEGRALTKMHIYGEAAVIASLNVAATPLFHDSTNAPVWRFDIGTHPTLWCCGYANSLVTVANVSIARPWLSLQWMIDQQSTEAKKTALRQNIRKSYSPLRFDASDTANDIAAYNAGTLQSIYSSLELGCVKEIWLAVLLGTNDPGVDSPELMQWYVDRSENNGGLFRCTNHVTDFVDGVVKCTSDGALFDSFPAAEAEYESMCDKLTALGFQVGTDGYGAGYPNVQNGNFMNNPSALFCANYGMHPWLEANVEYPIGGANAEANKTIRPYSHKWNGIHTLTSTNKLDGTAYTAQNVALLAGMGYTQAFVYSAAMYLHSTRFADFTQYTDDYCSQFLSAPDVWDNGTWEDCLANLEKGNTANIYI